MKVYTIEFGEFLLINGKSYRRCRNQTAMLDINSANAEVNYYLNNYFNSISVSQDNNISGYYLEVYIDDWDLSSEQIEYIEEYNCFTEGGTNLVKEIVVCFENSDVINYNCENYSD